LIQVQTLRDFFAQKWVQEGEPQVLFIKRAKRTGDRWSSHVALPGQSTISSTDHAGGKRDPEDADDRVTAERETREEIGIDLTVENSIYCGGLDQRMVSTSGTTVPLMVLCPYGIISIYTDDKCTYSLHPPYPSYNFSLQRYWASSLN